MSIKFQAKLNIFVGDNCGSALTPKILSLSAECIIQFKLLRWWYIIKYLQMIFVILPIIFVISQSIQSFNIPPLRQPTSFWLSSACVFRGGEFEPCLAGVGNLSWKSEGFKSWSMSRKSWLLILPLTKKLGGAFEHSFESGHANLKKFKFQMPG